MMKGEEETASKRETNRIPTTYMTMSDLLPLLGIHLNENNILERKE